MNVPGSGVLALPAAIPAPIGVTGGASIDVEFTWSVYDATLGLDQWQHVVTVSP